MGDEQEVGAPSETAPLGKEEEAPPPSKQMRTVPRTGSTGGRRVHQAKERDLKKAAVAPCRVRPRNYNERREKEPKRAEDLPSKARLSNDYEEVGERKRAATTVPASKARGPSSRSSNGHQDGGRKKREAAAEGQEERKRAATPASKDTQSTQEAQEERKRAARVSTDTIASSRKAQAPQEQQEQMSRASAASPGRVRFRNSSLPSQGQQAPAQAPPQEQAPARNDVNHIYDSENETSQHHLVPIKQEEGVEASTSNCAPSDQTAGENQTRVQQIAEYIAHQVIGNNPNPITMQQYAEKLYGFGFESVQMIQAYLKRRHIESFEWMNFLHKEIFLEKLDSTTG